MSRVAELKSRVRRGLEAVSNRVLGERALRFDQYRNLAASYELALERLGELDRETSSDERHRLLPRLLGTSLGEAYEIISALHATRALDGAVCEMGVAQGETSALIAYEIRGDGRRFHLFDTFEGLPPPTAEDELKDDIFGLGSMEAYTGTMSLPEQMVRGRLSAIGFPKDRYTIHRGLFGDVVAEGTGLPDAVSFAYVDFDFYEPIRQALDFVTPRMPVGGIVVVDDYDWFSTGAKTAVDEFCAAQNATGPVWDFRKADTALGHFCTLRRVAA